jgi:hypothetical protein
MDEEIRAELLQRADRDQAARNPLPPDGAWEEWETVAGPVDEASTAWLREVVAARGWPGQAPGRKGRRAGG